MASSPGSDGPADGQRAASECVHGRAVRALKPSMMVEHMHGAKRHIIPAEEYGDLFEHGERVTWDIGARDVPEAVTALQTAAHELKVPYAVGGVAGASFVRRASSPSTSSPGSGETMLTSGPSDSRQRRPGRPLVGSPCR